MKTREDLIMWFKLTSVKKLGPKKILNLFEIFENLQNIVNAAENDLLRTRIFKEDMAKDWFEIKNGPSEKFEEILSECQDNKINLIPLFSDEYPKQLKLMPYPPTTIFCKGDISLLRTKKVAIVGSRRSDDKSLKWGFDISEELAKEGVTIVSGGAKGIDYAAHSGALNAAGKTICVLGSGFLNLYPEEHKELFEKIGGSGLLLSEHPPNFSGTRISLLARNRITSGISDCILVVTSAKDGGAMTQLKIAYEQKVPIFCPKISLNLLPNDGIKEVLKAYNMTEVDTTNPIIDCLSSNKSSFLQSKMSDET